MTEKEQAYAVLSRKAFFVRCCPKYLYLENVPGLLNHDKGGTFKVILSTLDELGYDVAWQMLNSKDFGVPQSRKRVMLVGFLREKCAREVLSFTQTSDEALIQRKLFPRGESLLSEGCQHNADE